MVGEGVSERPTAKAAGRQCDYGMGGGVGVAVLGPSRVPRAVCDVTAAVVMRWWPLTVVGCAE